MLNPEPKHRSGELLPPLFASDQPTRPGRLQCVVCYGAWPCPTERRNIQLAGQVPAWTTADEAALVRRVRRLAR